MGIIERKERQREDLKEKILVAAESLFVTNGYKNVSMRKIAQKIEYSPTTLYRLFQNKAEIMEQLMEKGYRGVYQQYQEILNSPHDTSYLKLQDIIRVYIRFALENPSHYELWFSHSELEKKNTNLFMHHGALSYQVFPIWLDLIESCKSERKLAERDTQEIFQIMWSSVHGLISLRIKYTVFPWMPIEKHIDDCVNQLFAYLKV